MPSHRTGLMILSALLCLQSCVLVAFGAGAAAAILIHEAYIAEDTYEGVFRVDLDDAFEISLEVMRDLSFEKYPVYDRELHTIEGDINGAEVRIKISQYDRGEVSVRVQARKNFVADRETAVQIFRKIERRLTSG